MLAASLVFFFIAHGLSLITSAIYVVVTADSQQSVSACANMVAQPSPCLSY